MDKLLGFYADFLALSKANPVVAGAVGLWGAGLATWFLRNVPSNFFKAVLRQLTTTMVLNNAAGWGVNNEAHFLSFMVWYSKQRWSKYSRYFTATGGYNDNSKIVMGLGFGRHFFIYQKRFFIVTMTRLESQGTPTEKQQFQITGLTRNHQIMLDLMEEFRWRPEENKQIYTEWDGQSWDVPVMFRPRPMETVIINREVKEKIIQQIEFFQNNEKWFRDRGMTYKKTYVLHGVPGTGKTSLIAAIATYFQRPIHSIDLATMSGRSLMKAISTMPKRAILLIEDFEGSRFLKKRDQKQNSNTPKPEQNSGLGDIFDFDQMTLSSFLNRLDGIVALDDVIVMMTTNHLDQIDNAVLRKGRVDHIVELTPLEHEEVVEYIKMLFPTYSVPNNIRFNTIPGCDLQALFLEHQENVTAFVNAIPHLSKVASDKQLA